MSSPDNFDSLEKLLRLKQYEQPPPRYFRDFSGRVMSRIEAGEARTSWWERLGIDLRPTFAAAAGMLACGLVVYGVATADGNIEMGGDGASGGIPLPTELTARAFAQADHASPPNSTNPIPAFGTPIDHKVFEGGVIRASFPAPRR
ncbi:MAG TPA: hypothetical protein VNT99_05775 [Methylomirabilota bacterium]|nr:hypothetical protein [Methylomirabilota bacterium]